VAIARATLRHLALSVRCATLFVTHYPEIADLADELSYYRSASPDGAGSGSVDVQAASALGHVLGHAVGHMMSPPHGTVQQSAGSWPEALTDQRRVVNAHMAVILDDGPSDGGASDGGALPDGNLPDVTFLYEVRGGRAGSSHGLNVARLAGLPPPLVAHAARAAAFARNGGFARAAHGASGAVGGGGGGNFPRTMDGEAPPGHLLARQEQDHGQRHEGGGAGGAASWDAPVSTGGRAALEAVLGAAVAAEAGQLGAAGAERLGRILVETQRRATETVGQ